MLAWVYSTRGCAEDPLADLALLLTCALPRSLSPAAMLVFQAGLVRITS